MAFIQRPDGLGLVRDDFPRCIARNTSEPEEWSDILYSSCVPADFESLFDWIIVKEMPHGADPARKHEVIHVPRPISSRGDRKSDLRRLTVRIFGVVGNCNLSQLGNWDRTAGGCAKAIQFITICPGAFSQQFDDQKAGLHNIRHMVYRSMNEVVPPPRYREAEMFFHRKVFNVVKRYGPKPPPLESCSTDEARLESISCRWSTSSSATYARKLADNSLKRCSAMVICTGDFVDVTATVDIVSIGKGPRDRKVDVHFAFTRVVRLLSGQELTNIVGTQVPQQPQRDEPILYEDKLPFEDDIWDEDEVGTESAVVLAQAI